TRFSRDWSSDVCSSDLLEQRLDHLAALHGELLRQLGNGDGIADGDLAHDRCGRPREAVLAATGAGRLGGAGAGLLAGAGGAAAGTLGIAQMQLAGDEAAGALVALVVDHGVRAARLVPGAGLAGVTGGGARRRCRLLAMAAGRRALGLFHRRLAGGGKGGLLGGGAGGLFLGLATGLLGLLLLAALAVGLGQGGQLGGVAGLAFLQLAQRLGALLVNAGVNVVALDVGALLPDLNRDGGLALAGIDRQFFLLAPLQGDLL